MIDALNVTVYDGKYTVIQKEHGGVRALRYGQEWRDLSGDGLVLALAQEVAELRECQDEQMSDVKAFHEAFDCHVADEPGFPSDLDRVDLVLIQSYAHELANIGRHLKGSAQLANVKGRKGLGLLLIRLQLLTEETAELAQAMADRNEVEALDALSDIGYVNCGNYFALGMQNLKRQADAAVHQSNMSKLDDDGKPIIDGSGRVVKGPNYQTPKAALMALIENNKIIA